MPFVLIANNGSKAKEGEVTLLPPPCSLPPPRLPSSPLPSSQGSAASEPSGVGCRCIWKWHIHQEQRGVRAGLRESLPTVFLKASLCSHPSCCTCLPHPQPAMGSHCALKPHAPAAFFKCISRQGGHLLHLQNSKAGLSGV